jgi:hypothetical protein
MPKKAKTEAEPEVPNVGPLQPLLEAMITLLGRFVYPPEKIMEIVTFKKRNPEQYVAIYNLCDGEHTGSEIAKTFNQDQGGLSRILSDWKDLGIVYEITKKGGRFYKKLYKLGVPRETEETEQEETVAPPEPVVATNVQPPEQGKPDESTTQPPSN